MLPAQEARGDDPKIMLDERRRIRSDISPIALSLYLRATLERNQLAEFILADDRGLLIASHRPGARAELVAAVVAVLADGKSVDPRLYDLDLGELHMKTMSLDGQPCTLAAVGKQCPDMEAAKEAMARIYQEGVAA